MILHIRTAPGERDRDTAELGPLTYLLESGSDRVGALDYQHQPDHYETRGAPATLDELAQAAARLEAGVPFSPELDAALVHGSSIGGARPKALLDDGNRMLIAKFSSRTDHYPVVRAEAVAMDLARRAGLDVARSELTECLGRDVLLVERFDRTPGSRSRRIVVSALTILQLDELAGRYATYPALADEIRTLFTQPKATLRELFARIVFNVCIGNTDDHARNHAAFWDGDTLTLTPAYDLCPQSRTGGEATQAMAIGRDEFRYSQLAGCVDAAPVFQLSRRQAADVIEGQVDTIVTEWAEAADAARLTAADRLSLWRRQILNPYAFKGYEGRTASAVPDDPP